MSFDVVAASRVEQRKITAGRHVLATGIQFGVAGAFLGIVYGVHSLLPPVAGSPHLGETAVPGAAQSSAVPKAI